METVVLVVINLQYAHRIHITMAVEVDGGGRAMRKSASGQTIYNSIVGRMCVSAPLFFVPPCGSISSYNLCCQSTGRTLWECESSNHHMTTSWHAQISLRGRTCFFYWKLLLLTRTKWQTLWINLCAYKREREKEKILTKRKVLAFCQSRQ